MDLRLIEYLFYLSASVVLTVWVGRTLHRNGRRFLVDVMEDESLADSVNRLLLVGFYLINLGFVGLYIRNGMKPMDTAGAVEETSDKVGTVTLVLGIMHLFNLYVFNKIRRRALLPTLPPPVPADGRIALP